MTGRHFFYQFQVSCSLLAGLHHIITKRRVDEVCSPLATWPQRAGKKKWCTKWSVFRSVETCSSRVLDRKCSQQQQASYCYPVAYQSIMKNKVLLQNGRKRRQRSAREQYGSCFWLKSKCFVILVYANTQNTVQV